MKLAVSGKGGVGKTTTCALLATALKARGRNVIAIDADPDSNLAACLGYSDPASIKPLVELKELIEDRTGVKPGTTGGMFQLNPFVADIPEKYSVEVNGIKVLVAGGVKKGGTGCYCPENSLLRALVSHLLLDKDTDLVIDMEAGVEHLGRGTVQAVDRLVMITDPGRRSLETSLRIKGLADDIGLENIGFIGNKIQSEDDKNFLIKELSTIPLIGFLPYNTALLESERSGAGVGIIEGELAQAADEMLDKLMSEV